MNSKLVGIKRQVMRMLRNNSGILIIKTALLLPVLLVFVFAAIEFGNFFVKWMIVQRANSVAAGYVRTIFPNLTTSDASGINAAVPAIISKVGYGFTHLDICGVVSANPPASNCGTVRVARANAGVGQSSPYRVGLRVSTPYSPLTPLLNLVPIAFPNEIVATSVVKVFPATPTPPSATCGLNQFVVYKAATNEYVCTGVTPVPPTASCTADQLVTYDATTNSYSCKDVRPTCDWDGVPPINAFCNNTGGEDGDVVCSGEVFNVPLPYCQKGAVNGRVTDIPLGSIKLN